MGITLSFISAWLRKEGIKNENQATAIAGFRTEAGTYEAWALRGEDVISMIGDVAVAESKLIAETIGAAIGQMSIDEFPGGSAGLPWQKFPDSFIIEQGLKKFVKREAVAYKDADGWDQLYTGIFDPYGEGFVFVPKKVELPPEEIAPVRSRFAKDDGSYAQRLRDKRNRAEQQETADAVAETQARVLNDTAARDRLRKGRETPEAGDVTGTIRLEAPGAANGTKFWTIWALKLTKVEIEMLNRVKVSRGKAEDMRPWQVNVRFGTIGGTSDQTREVGRASTRSGATRIRNEKADKKNGSTRDGATYGRIY